MFDLNFLGFKYSSFSCNILFSKSSSLLQILSILKAMPYTILDVMWLGWAELGKRAEGLSVFLRYRSVSILPFSIRTVISRKLHALASLSCS